MNMHIQLPSPHNVEAEMSVIGCVLRDNALYDRVREIVTADEFFEPLHARLWDCIGEMIQQGRKASIVALRDALGQDVVINGATPSQYMAHVVAEYGMPFNLIDSAEIVHAMAIRRRLISAAEEVIAIAAGASPVQKLEEIVGDCEATMADAISSHKAPDDIDPAQQAINEMSAAYQRQCSDGIPWCLREAQSVMGDDLEPGWLIGLLADSGGGKTSLALQQAEHTLRGGKPVLFLSGDQKPSEVYKQLASQRASVQSSDLRKGRASSEEIEKSIKVIHDLQKRPFIVKRMGRPTTAEISMQVRSFTRQFGAGLVIIDHAKRISFTDRRAMLSEGVNQVYGDLKALMQETDNVCLLLMQRNSEGGGRENPRPIRSDAYGGAGAFENLDGLMALYVEEQWIEHMLGVARTSQRKQEIEMRREQVRDRAELIGLKCRFSAQGNREYIKREAKFTRFASLAEEWRGGQEVMEL